MSRKGREYKILKGSKKVPVKWTAPETLISFIYTKKTAVYSYGVLMWEVFSDGAEPFKDLDGYAVRKLVSCTYRFK